MDWGTLIFDFGRPQVRAFLIASALFWIEQYHIDGLRVDAVASMLYLDYSRQPGEWVPNKFGGRENLEAVQFLKDFNVEVHGRFPGVVTFAEESTAWPMVTRPVYLGGLGFDYKWNMGWMHDMLAYMSQDPIHRMYHQNQLTFSLYYAFSENFMLPLSHDEVVHGKRSLLSKMPGDIGLRFANLRALYGWMFAHPGKKLLFMGDEFGQWKEWNEADELDWPLLKFDTHRGLKLWVHDLNRRYAAEPALHEVDDSWQGFQWIDCTDVERSIVAALRRASDPHDYVVVVANFTPVARPAYRIGVPAGGGSVELLNSDSAAYGGGDVGNAGYVEALHEPSHGQPWCLELMLPPLGVLILKPVIAPGVRAAEEAARVAAEEAARAAEARRLVGEEDALAAAHSPAAPKSAARATEAVRPNPARPAARPAVPATPEAAAESAPPATSRGAARKTAPLPTRGAARKSAPAPKSPRAAARPGKKSSG
jgi:1,4-alpha-glucan branching enzyme